MNQCLHSRIDNPADEARCVGCGKLLENVATMSAKRVFHAPRSSTQLQLKRRIVSAVLFAVSALVPIFFLGGTPGGASSNLTGVVFFLLPVAIAGFFGFALGPKILDPSATHNGSVAAWKGTYTAGLSFIVYIAILAVVLSYNNFSLSTADKISGWIGMFVIFLLYGSIFVGWVALFVGAASGLLLYRLSLVTGPELRFSNIPNAITLKDLAISSAIVFGIFSPIFISRVVYPFVYRYLESESAKTERLKIQMVSAAHMGDAEAIRLLLAEGADPNSRHLTGQTPLALVVPNGHKDAAKALLEYGADPNAADPNDWTPLIWATGSVDPEMMRILVESGADVNLSSGMGDYTPLIRAALANNIEAAKYLLEKGAKINARKSTGQDCIGVHKGTAKDEHGLPAV